jgi:hypothetical protein
MNYNYKHLILGAVAVTTILVGCTDPTPDGNDPNGKVKIPPDIITVGKTFDVNGQIFSIPSPMQTAMLIKDSGADFDDSYLNPKDNADGYSTMFSKSMNLGVYGADLGYCTIYENNNASLAYLTSVRTLASEVGVENAFNESLIERFSANSTNQDSMLVFISEAYQSADNYLKTNDKSDVAGLILAGGWIEALHFSCRVALDGNKALQARIGEQKSTLKSLIGLLNSLESSGDDFEEFVYGMEDLYGAFDQVSSSYKYIEPQTYADKKLTIFNSTNDVEISDDVLAEIASQVAELRDLITQ